MTPSPWSIEYMRALLRYGRKNGDGWLDDTIQDGEWAPDEDDAALMCAAPMMLEALEFIAALDPESHASTVARLAVARAKGDADQ